MNRIIYVSNNAILNDGTLNPFFQQEKEWFSEKFGIYWLVCPKGIYLCSENGSIKPLYTYRWFHILLAYICCIVDINIYFEINRMVRDNAASVKNILKLFRFSAHGSLLESYILRILKKEGTSNFILYSYWLSFDAYACSKIKEKHPWLVAISRAHSYELQLHRNSCNPYLMKKHICTHLDKIAFISSNAMNSLASYYPIGNANAKIIYLGSTRKNTCYIQRLKKESLVILTCSSITPIKRLDWIIKAICDWTLCDLKWIHIGDGELKNDIKILAKELLDKNKHVSYQFTGKIENIAVHKFMMKPEIDLFVNMSESEGVPVTIMEAMSYGIPIIAPSIFGIPELVDHTCGFLFNPSDGIEALKKCLDKFVKIDSDERTKMGKAAYQKWKANFCLEDNLCKLFSGYN